MDIIKKRLQWQISVCILPRKERGTHQQKLPSDFLSHGFAVFSDEAVASQKGLSE